MNKWYITNGLGKGYVLDNEFTVDKDRQIIYYEFTAKGFLDAWKIYKRWIEEREVK